MKSSISFLFLLATLVFSFCATLSAESFCQCCGDNQQEAFTCKTQCRFALDCTGDEHCFMNIPCPEPKSVPEKSGEKDSADNSTPASSSEQLDSAAPSIEEMTNLPYRIRVRGTATAAAKGHHLSNSFLLTVTIVIGLGVSLFLALLYKLCNLKPNFQYIHVKKVEPIDFDFDIDDEGTPFIESSGIIIGAPASIQHSTVRSQSHSSSRPRAPSAPRRK